MITPNKLRELLSQKEGVKLEFKSQMYKLFHDENRKKENNPQWNELIKDVISLANGNIESTDEIGYLIIGASDKPGDDGHRILTNTDSLGESDKNKLVGKLKEICDPPFEGLEFESVPCGDKRLFVISVSPRPYLYVLKKHLKTEKKEFSEGAVIIRREGGHIDIALDQERLRIRAEKERRLTPQPSDNYKKLTDFKFILENINKNSPSILLQEYSDHLKDKSILRNPLDRADILQLLEAALRRSEEALEQDANQLSSQLLGRLLFSTDLKIQNILDNIKEWQEVTGATWLEPITSSLKLPLAFLLRNLKNPDHVTTLAVNLTSSKLVSGSRKGTLSVWSLDEDKSLPPLTQKHKKEINIVAVSPDNQKIISASADYRIKVCDINSGNLLLDLDGHQDLINSIAITPNGRELISASDDCTLRRWCLVSGSLLEEPTEFSDPVMNSVITQDGQYVFFSIDDAIKIWDLSNNHIRAFSEKHDSRINILRLFPDQKRIVSASDDNTLRILNIEQESCQGKLDNYRASDLVVAPDSQSIIFVDDDEKFNPDDKNLIIWNWRSGKVEFFEGHQDEINALALVPNRKWLITASKDLSIKIWDIANQKLLERISCNNDEPIAIAVAPNGKQFICALDDKSLQIWKLLDDQTINVDEIHDDKIDSIEFLSGEERIISVSDKQIKLWQVSDGLLLKTFTVQEHIHTHAVENKKLVLTSGEDGKLTIHHLDLELIEGKPLEGHSERINAIILTCGDKYAISASEDCPASASKEQRIYNLIVWDLEEGIVHKYLEGHINPISTLTANLEKQLLISVSADKTIVWNLETFELLYTVAGESALIKQLINKNIYISPRDRYAISGTNDPDIKIWDLSTGELLFSLSRRNVSAVAVIASSERLVSASNNSLEIWSIQDEAEPLGVLVAHSANINAVTTTSCGRYAISVSDDRTVKVWDLDQAELIATFTGDSEMTSCAVANDGVTIFAGERSGRVHFLRLHGI